MYRTFEDVLTGIQSLVVQGVRFTAVHDEASAAAGAEFPVIRVMDRFSDDDGTCPLCALAGIPGCNAKEAAELLGIDDTLRRAVVAAADGWGGVPWNRDEYERPLPVATITEMRARRAQLETACGLGGAV